MAILEEKKAEGVQMAIDHKQRARDAWPYLVKRAAKGPPYTYKELSSLIGVHHRAAQYYLGVIQTYCGSQKWPALQALAVNGTTRLPGPGYVGSIRTHAGHAKELTKVSAKTDWPPKAPF
jgi:hypothetical protein